jgi:archaellum component FlaC
MSEKYKDLDDTFNVIPTEVSIEKKNDIEKKIEKFKNSGEDIKKDYEYTRGNLYSIIEKGQEAINGILELAQESEMPRAYEVAGQLIKNVADATDKLMTLQQKLKDVNKEEEAKNPTNVTNALFVGSTAELQKLLKNTNTDK